MKKFFVVFLIALVLLGIAAVWDSVYNKVSAEESEPVEVETAAEPVYLEQKVEVTPPSFMAHTLYVLGDHVNERERPNTDALVLNYYCAGEVVEVVDKTGDWYQLSSGGYIREDLLTDDYDAIVPHFLETYQDLIVTHISHGQRTEYWYYGEMIASGDCVTGDAYKSPTPPGLYWITSRQTDVDQYKDSDDWFCTFNGLIGYHNAVWRWGFGGEIYKGMGSAGCVNCTNELAKAIFDHCRVGYTYVLILP